MAKKMTEQPIINTELTRLRKEYPILGNRKPLAIGIRAMLLPLINLSSKNSRKVIRQLCNHPTYLKNIGNGGDRFNLDGTASGKITQDEMDNAKLKLSGDLKDESVKENPSNNTLKLRRTK